MINSKCEVIYSHILRKDNTAFWVYNIGLNMSPFLRREKIDLKIAEYWKEIPNASFLEKYRWVVLKINGQIRAFNHDKPVGDYWSYFQVQNKRLLLEPKMNVELVSYF